MSQLHIQLPKTILSNLAIFLVHEGNGNLAMPNDPGTAYYM